MPTFADAAGVVDLIAQSGVQYDSVGLLVNVRESVEMLTQVGTGGYSPQQVCLGDCV